MKRISYVWVRKCLANRHQECNHIKKTFTVLPLSCHWLHNFKKEKTENDMWTTKPIKKTLLLYTKLQLLQCFKNFYDKKQKPEEDWCLVDHTTKKLYIIKIYILLPI